MAVNKVINRSTKTHKSLSNILKYILRNDKVKDEGCISITGPYSSLSIKPDDIYDQWIKEKKLWGKDSGRMYAHNIISFHRDEAITPTDVLDIGRQFADKFFSDNQSVISVHQDKGHLHCHIVTNTVSFIDGRKLHQNKHDLEEQKSYTNALCRQKGLTVAEKGHHFNGTPIEVGEVITWSKDKYNLLLRDKDRSFISRCAKDISQAIYDSIDEDSFLEAMHHQRKWKVTKKSNEDYVFEDEKGHKVSSINLNNTLGINISAMLADSNYQKQDFKEENDYDIEYYQ